MLRQIKPSFAMSMLALVCVTGCQGPAPQQATETTTVLSPTSAPTFPSATLGLQGRIRPTQEPYCKTFSDTPFKVCDEFLAQWQAGGELLRYGLPLSDWFYEVGEKGEIYPVQYFEQHVIKLQRPSPESNMQGWTPVPHVPLGGTIYSRKYPSGAPGQVVNKTGRAPVQVKMNPEIWLGGPFADFLPQSPDVKAMDVIDWIGTPISNEFTEKNNVDGKEYKVQYFEEAALEYHPENKPPDDVRFAPLGLYEFKHRYPNSLLSNPTPSPRPYATAGSGLGCYRQTEMATPISPTPAVSLADAEASARDHYSQTNNGRKLGPLVYSKYTSVDITAAQSDIEIIKDAWQLSFLTDVPTATPYPTPEWNDMPGPTYSYLVYIDAETSKVLPGCEWGVIGMP